MGPVSLRRLAPLVLLLLALCGLSSPAAVSPKAIGTKPTPKVDAKVPTAQKDKVKTEGYAKGYLSLALAVELMDMSDADLGPDKELMNNGVLCALDRPNNADEMKKVFYGVSPLDAQMTTEDRKAADEFGIGDCSTPTVEEDKCFCPQTKVALYCIGEKWKRKHATGFTRGRCASEVIKELNTQLPKLAAAYDYATFASEADKLKTALSKLQDDDWEGFDALLGPKFEDFFCDAADERAPPLIEALMKSDPVYPLMERAGFLALAGDEGAAEEMAADCANIEPEVLSKHPFVQCLCEGKLGFRFCIYRALGDFFKKEEYIKCPPAPDKQSPRPAATKDPLKKPTTPPKIVPSKKSGGGGGGKNATTPTPDGAPGGASLLPVLLTAAAAAAALRH